MQLGRRSGIAVWMVVLVVVLMELSIDSDKMV